MRACSKRYWGCWIYRCILAKINFTLPQIYTPEIPDHLIPPCVMVSSAMGLSLGVFGFSPTTHPKTITQNKCIQDFCVLCGVLGVFVFMLRLQYMQITYAPDKSRLFGLQENPKTPKFSLMLGQSFWDLWRIHCWSQYQL